MNGLGDEGEAVTLQELKWVTGGKSRQEGKAEEEEKEEARTTQRRCSKVRAGDGEGSDRDSSPGPRAVAAAGVSGL